MWDLRYAFTQAPGVVETFTRDGNVLRGEGSGIVIVIVPSRSSSRALTIVTPITSPSAL